MLCIPFDLNFVCLSYHILTMHCIHYTVFWSLSGQAFSMSCRNCRGIRSRIWRTRLSWSRILPPDDEIDVEYKIILTIFIPNSERQHVTHLQKIARIPYFRKWGVKGDRPSSKGPTLVSVIIVHRKVDCEGIGHLGRIGNVEPHEPSFQVVKPSNLQEKVLALVRVVDRPQAFISVI